MLVNLDTSLHQVKRSCSLPYLVLDFLQVKIQRLLYTA